jgi:hypothetical protein
MMMLILSEEGGIVKDVEGSFTKWKNDEIIWV